MIALGTNTYRDVEFRAKALGLPESGGAVSKMLI